MVSVTDYSIVGTGETVPDAMRDYQQALKNVGMRPNLSETDQALSITGTVLRIASEFNGTSTEYKLILAEAKDMIYLVDTSLSDELALTQPGDRVKIEYYQNPGSSTQAASGFDNLEFSQAA